jgi:hypothetical protein
MGRNSEQKTKKKKKDFLIAYKGCDCNISRACIKSDVGRNTFYTWMKSDPKFVDDVINTKEDLIDEFESLLIKIARGYTMEITSRTVDAEGKKSMTKREIYIQPNYPAIKDFLAAKARSRGYGIKPDSPDEDGENDTDEQEAIEAVD